MLVRITPCAALAPVVEALWAFDAAEDRVPDRAPRERALPTGRAHIVFRLSGPPIRVFTGVEDRAGCEFGYAVASGTRSAFYVRSTSSPSSSVGVQFTPYGAAALLGIPAHEIAERHVPLDTILGSQAIEVRDRLLEAASPAAQLRLLEQILLAWTRNLVPCHPAIARAVARFDAEAGCGSIDEARVEAGLSHRRFVELFERAVGLTPKVYCRIVRFQRAIRAARGCAAGWAGIASACGFYDQAHLNREFRAFAGVTPGAYVPTSPERPNHVPIRSSDGVKSVQER